MNKAFEKILKKIEEKRNKYQILADSSNFDGWHEEDITYSAKAEMCEELKEIVQEVAEEYNGGWISCSERLPEDGVDVLVWFEYFRYGNYNRLYQTMGISYTYNGKWSGFVNGESEWNLLTICMAATT